MARRDRAARACCDWWGDRGVAPAGRRARHPARSRRRSRPCAGHACAGRARYGGEARPALSADRPGTAPAVAAEPPHAEVQHHRLPAERPVGAGALIVAVHLRRPVTAHRAGGGATSGRYGNHDPLGGGRDGVDAQPPKLRKQTRAGHKDLQKKSARDAAPLWYGFAGPPATSSKLGTSHFDVIGDRTRSSSGSASCAGSASTMPTSPTLMRWPTPSSPSSGGGTPPPIRSSGPLPPLTRCSPAPSPPGRLSCTRRQPNGSLSCGDVYLDALRSRKDVITAVASAVDANAEGGEPLAE